MKAAWEDGMNLQQAEKRIKELVEDSDRMRDVLWNVSRATFCCDAVALAKDELREQWYRAEERKVNRKLESLGREEMGKRYSIEDVVRLEKRVEELEAALLEAEGAIEWMSGSADFGPEGQAHDGWIKIRAKVFNSKKRD